MDGIQGLAPLAIQCRRYAAKPRIQGLAPLAILCRRYAAKTRARRDQGCQRTAKTRPFFVTPVHGNGRTESKLDSMPSKLPPLLAPPLNNLQIVRAGWLMLLCLLLSPGDCFAALVTNPALPITRQVTVQPIIVSDDDGSNTAGYLGTVLQTAAIQDDIDFIWAQAGIDIEWRIPNFWDNTFANFGNLLPTQTRPIGDLAQIVTNGAAAGVASPDSSVLNMYFVEIVPFFAQTSLLTANGLAQLGGVGSAIHVGDNLPGAIFMGEPIGQHVSAQVIAHEIGHNLGLDHISDAQNLMLEMGTLQPVSAALNQSQITIARSSQFATAVPEPGSLLACGSIVTGMVLRRRRRRAPVTSAGVRPVGHGPTTH